MQTHRLLLAAAVVLFVLRSLAVAADGQQEMGRMLPEVSLVAESNPSPVLADFGPKTSCGEAGEGDKGCAAAIPSLTPRRKGLAAKTDKSQSSDGAPLSLGIGDKELQNHSPKLEPGTVLNAPVVLLPETTTTVKLSASDLNRIICPSDIKEALTSDEKGLMIKITGKDAFVKYKVSKRSDGKISYSSTPTEIFVVCGGSTYSMIAYPGRVPSQTIRLSSGTENKIKDNQALYAGIPFEKRLMRAIKEVYTDNIPESYSVVNQHEVDNSWRSLIVTSRRKVDVEGEGIQVKEFHITLKPGYTNAFKLSEKMFIRKEFALNPVAVAIDKHVLRPGDVSRLFIVEQRADKPLGGNSFILPTLDGGTSIAPQQETPKTSASFSPSGSDRKSSSKPITLRNN